MTQKSSDQLLESLSALVDNEASELEVRRILKNVEFNPEVRDRWRSYNLIGSVLRKEVDLNLGDTKDIAEQISLALRVEQTFEAKAELPNETLSVDNKKGTDTQATRRGMFDFIAKSAVAASFAGALVVGFNLLSPDQVSEFESDSNQVVDAVNARVADPVLTAPVGFELPRIESRTVGTGSSTQIINPVHTQALPSSQADDITDPATQDLLNELLIHHAARASANGSLGIMPFARVSQMQQAEVSE